MQWQNRFGERMMREWKGYGLRQMLKVNSAILIRLRMKTCGLRREEETAKLLTFSSSWESNASSRFWWPFSTVCLTISTSSLMSLSSKWWELYEETAGVTCSSMDWFPTKTDVLISLDSPIGLFWADLQSNHQTEVCLGKAGFALLSTWCSCNPKK